MPQDVGEYTALVDSGRHLPKRGGKVAWALLAITLAGGGLAGWILWEQGRLARDEASDAQRRLGDANARAAAAETEVLALSADQLRPPSEAPADAADLVAIAADLRGAIDRAAGDVAVDDARDRVVVTLDDPDLFRTGDADLTRRGDGLVVKLAGALIGAGDRTLWVHGHVDDAPLPDDSTFESAWELSSARALAIVERFAEEGIDARRLAAVAFGAERPASKDRAKNRRIEIIVDGAAPTAKTAARSAVTRSR